MKSDPFYSNIPIYINIYVVLLNLKPLCIFKCIIKVTSNNLFIIFLSEKKYNAKERKAFKTVKFEYLK